MTPLLSQYALPLLLPRCTWCLPHVPLTQVSVLEEISRGEVLLAVARRCLKLMQDFVDTLKVLAEPGAAAASGDPAAPRPQELGFEMVCALVNNSVDCYNQSLEFTDHVQVRRDTA